jgi:hypothetical protein
MSDTIDIHSDLTKQNCVLTRRVKEEEQKRIKSLILDVARDIKLVLILIFMFHEIERQAKIGNLRVEGRFNFA